MESFSLQNWTRIEARNRALQLFVAYATKVRTDVEAGSWEEEGELICRFSIPKELRPPAQGCEERANLGQGSELDSTVTRLWRNFRWRRDVDSKRFLKVLTQRLVIASDNNVIRLRNAEKIFADV
jgi:hypothetical protein